SIHTPNSQHENPRRIAPPRVAIMTHRHAIPRAVRRSTDCDVDLARRGFRPLRDLDFQHAVLAGRADGVRIGAVRQGEAAVEHAARAFDAGVLAVLDLALALALAADRQHALVHVDFDVLGIDARNVGFDHEALVLFANVHARRPFARHPAGRVAVGHIEQTAKSATDLAREMAGGRPVSGTLDIHAALLKMIGRNRPLVPRYGPPA